MTPEEEYSADVTRISEYANTMTIEEVMAYLEENECVVESAWLTSAMAMLERQFVITAMTAYAAAKDELLSIQLSIGPVEADEDV